MRAMLKQRGFTLIELMVVIAILAMLVGVSIFSWRAWQKSAPIIEALDHVEQYCALARSKAITRQRPMDLVLLESEIVLMTAAQAVEGVNEYDEVTNEVNPAREVQRAEFSPDVTVLIFNSEDEQIEIPDDGLFVRFYPNGTCEPLLMKIEGPSASYAVGLDPVTGRTKTLKDN